MNITTTDPPFDPRHPSASVVARQLVLLSSAFVLAIITVTLYYWFVDRPRARNAGYRRVREQTTGV